MALQHALVVLLCSLVLPALANPLGTARERTLLGKGSYRSNRGRSKGSSSGIRRAGTCDLRSGSWVPDASPPRYNLTSCPLLWPIGRTTYCLNKRKKSQSWLHWQWMPSSCPGPNKFDATYFVQKMKDKVIALVGDSLMAFEFFPSLLCQISVRTRVRLDQGWSAYYGASAYAVQDYNVVIVNFWSPFLVATSTNPWYLHRLRDKNIQPGDTAVNLAKADPAWAQHLAKFDLLIMTSSAHWPHARTWDRRFFTDYHWKLITPQPDTLTGYKMGMKTVIRYLDPSKGWKVPASYFLSASPRLPLCKSATAPSLSNTAYNFISPRNAASRTWFPLQASLMKNYMQMVDVTHMSLYRADAMVGAGNPRSIDCLHPCIPGLPDSWVDLFYLHWLHDRRFN